MSDVTQEIEDLRQMATGDLVVRYEALFGKPPRRRNREHLWKRCAWKIQEQRFGGLSKVAKRRLEELVGEIDVPLGGQQRTVSGHLNVHVRPADHTVGTVFTRTWHGREVRTVAVEGGYECDGVVYRSLSAVAKAVTGAHWSGRRFFGLTQRKKR